MAGENTVSTFAGFLKTKYAQNIVNTIPEGFVAQNDFPFGAAGKIGEQYQQAVITALEQGATYAAGASGTFTINDAVAGSIEKALVNSSQFMLKSAIDYETLSKAIKKGEMAYGSAGDQLMKNMAMSTRKRLEISMWLGQFATGCGALSAIGSNIATITQASWPPGAWIGMEGAVVEIFDSTLATNRGSATLSSVNHAERKLTLSATPGGTTAGDVIVFKDMVEAGPTWNDFMGVLKIYSTTSGTLFNISTAKSVWKPETLAVGGPLTFAKCQESAMYYALKGGDRTLKAYVPLRAWLSLLTEQAAQRHYGGEFDGRTELVDGGKAIRFWTMSGQMLIKPVAYMPEGYALLVADGSIMRVGSTDVTFQVPGMNEPLAHVSDTVAGIVLMAYYNQAVFTPEPGLGVLLTGITYS
ncbi:MAG: hypothetical protein JW940_04500 [Polyangiaceae bacterium]|nr:hypothetical protein [Polyangiaceae bacterium]